MHDYSRDQSVERPGLIRGHQGVLGGELRGETEGCAGPGPPFRAVGAACAKALWQGKLTISKVPLKPGELERRGRVMRGPGGLTEELGLRPWSPGRLCREVGLVSG